MGERYVGGRILGERDMWKVELGERYVGGGIRKERDNERGDRGREEGVWRIGRKIQGEIIGRDMGRENWERDIWERVMWEVELGGRDMWEGELGKRKIMREENRGREGGELGERYGEGVLGERSRMVRRRVK